MTTFNIKLIAIITMVIDHIGLFFFPNIIELRMIGRLSFPLFAWLIANGAYYTHNIKKYLMRILLLAFVSQIPYTLANRHADPSFSNLNILFTLSLGLLAITVISKYKNKPLWLLSVILCAAAADMLRTDYGVFGVLSIVAFYLFFNNMKYLILSQALIFLLPMKYLFGPVESLGLFSLIFIMLYNKKEGPKTKYLFYIFYPLQYLVIYLIQIH